MRYGNFRSGLCVAALLWPVVLWADIQLDFGLYASDKPTHMVKKFRPLIKDLERALSRELGEPVRIRLQVASSYQKGIDQIAAGTVDFARLGPASYVEVSERDAGVRILAVESKKGAKRFNGVICVAQGSAINTVEDLKGKRFAFGNELSTIGRYLSQQYLLSHGIKAPDLVGYEYLGRHDLVGYAVSSGQFDAGALKESTYKRLVRQGVPVRAIATFPNVTKPWVARSNIGERIFVTLRQTLLQYQEPAGLKALGKDGFLAGSRDDYGSTRDAVLNNHDFFQ